MKVLLHILHKSGQTVGQQAAYKWVQDQALRIVRRMLVEHYKWLEFGHTAAEK